MPNVSTQDTNTLVSFLQDYPGLWDRKNLCEAAKDNLQKALTRRNEKTSFILGIIITVILNIFGLLIWYLWKYDESNAAPSVPDVANNIN